MTFTRKTSLSKYIFLLIATLMVSTEVQARESVFDIAAKILKGIERNSTGQVKRSELEKLFNEGAYLCYQPDQSSWLASTSSCDSLFVPVQMRGDSIDAYLITIEPHRRLLSKITMNWDEDLLCDERGYPHVRAMYEQLTAGRVVDDYIHFSLEGMQRLSSSAVKEVNETIKLEFEGRMYCYGIFAIDDENIVEKYLQMMNY